MSECHRDGERYVLTGRHQTGCEGDCAGCVHCPDHCTCRTACPEHVGPTELTAPKCIGRTRDDLAMIVTLAALMLDEAVERGIDSEAANLAGPAADPEAWSWRKVAAKQGGSWHASLIEDDDEHHPLFVLGVWDMMLREDYGPDTTERITVTSTAGYLDHVLHRLANDREQDFPLFAGEVRRCRTHMEAVLHDSRLPEMGAPCPICTALTGRGPKLVKRYVDEDVTGASDEWRCSVCGNVWREADYRLRVSATYVQHADALTADQIHAEYRVKPGTLRKWAHEKRVAKRGYDGNGRQLYDVAQVKAAREQASRLVP